MSRFFVRNAENLDGLLLKLDTMKGENKYVLISMSLTEEYADEELRLFKVLSHPYSKINRFELEEAEPDALAASKVLKIIRRWCEEVPTASPRSILISLDPHDTIETQTALYDLRIALHQPNNAVKELNIIDAPCALRICELLVGPVLEHPNNEVTKVSLEFLEGFGNAESSALSNGLASPHCKVKAFSTGNCLFPSVDALSLISAVSLGRSLEQLEWRNAIDSSEEECINGFLVVMARLLERPGKPLRNLHLATGRWQQSHLAMLAKALINERCQLAELVYEGQSNGVSFPLFDIIGNGNCQLRWLTIDIRGGDAGAVNVVDLMEVNRWLDSLTFFGCSHDKAEALADILGMGGLETLRVLELSHQSPVVFRAFTKSLRSARNKLRVLRLPEDASVDDATRSEYFKALRVSNVVNVQFHAVHPFRKAFNAPFFQVLHTLMSIKHVPRLGRFACAKILPIQDLILRIADILGWPLHDLRV